MRNRAVSGKNTMEGSLKRKVSIFTALTTVLTLAVMALSFSACQQPTLSLSGNGDARAATPVKTLTGPNGTVLLSGMSGTSLTVTYNSPQVSSCYLYVSQGNNVNNLVLQHQAMTYANGAYRFTFSNTSYKAGVTIYVGVLKNVNGVETLVPQGVLATNAGWGNFIYGSYDSTASATPAPTSAPSVFMLTGTAGTVYLSAMSGTNVTVSYTSPQVTSCYLYLSQGNNVNNLVLSHQAMTYANGAYSFTYANATYTAGARIYVGVLKNVNGVETLVPQGILATNSSWGSFIYGTYNGTATATPAPTTSPTPTVTPTPNPNSPKSSMTLKWMDDFTGSSTTPDTASWTYDTTDTVGGGWGNNEVETYTNSRTNTFVSGGVLNIVAVKNGSNWTSGRIKTKGLKDYTYGFFEVRAMVPTGIGAWPALWMLPTNNSYGTWPASGEIDIMEASYNMWGPGNARGTVHNNANSGSAHGNAGTSLGNKTFSDMASAYHLYAVYWTSSKISLYYDDVLMGTYANPNSGTNAWPYNIPYHLIMNIAMGGNLGGTISSSLSSVTMMIDYVKVYQ